MRGINTKPFISGNQSIHQTWTSCWILNFSHLTLQPILTEKPKILWIINLQISFWKWSPQKGPPYWIIMTKQLCTKAVANYNIYYYIYFIGAPKIPNLLIWLVRFNIKYQYQISFIMNNINIVWQMVDTAINCLLVDFMSSVWQVTWTHKYIGYYINLI